MNLPQSTVETERLCLDTLTLQDSLFVLKLVNTEGWLTFIGDRNVKSIAEANQYIEKITRNQNVMYWVVTRKEDNEKIGVVTLIKREHLPQIDFGFAFLPEFGKKGYAYEASTGILDHLRQEPELAMMLAITVPHNVDSIRLLEKLNFKFSKEMVQNGETLSVYQRERAISG